jgi:hypothetical protein
VSWDECKWHQIGLWFNEVDLLLLLKSTLLFDEQAVEAVVQR